MDNVSMSMQKEGGKDESIVQYTIEHLASNQESLVSNKLDPEQTPTPKFRRSISSSASLELICPASDIPHGSIPKHITTFDEKYVLHCLELIRNYALRAANGNFGSKAQIFPDNLSSISLLDMAKLSTESHSPIGSITNSQSMMNILSSPLLQKFESIDFKGNLGKKGTLLDFRVSPQKKEVNIVDHEYVHGQGHNNHLSKSSVNSSCSDITSSFSATASSSPFQGMIQSTWKNGIPNLVFSVDDKKEVYVANFSKVESLDDNTLDYVYTFRSRESHLGTMRVSTSTMFGLDNSKIRETRFVLTISDGDSKPDIEVSNHVHRKNKTLTRKMGKVLKSSLSYKQRSHSKLSGSGAIVFEDNPSEDVHNSVEIHVPNLEMAAIVVRNVCKADFGGWGLKFLKKLENDMSVCSSSTDVIIPAGVHGGPKTGGCGSSSLFERWVSGGKCDCGGWDLGCPLTVLEMASSSAESSSGNCKSADLFVQGSKQDIPMLRMVNIHDGLYYVHFQSRLSNLQTFAIATAIIHCRSPVLLRPKVYRS